MYHEGNLTQQEVADELGISRGKVKRTLDKLKEGEEEHLPDKYKEGDTWIITARQSGKVIEIHEDKLRRLKELYCGNPPLQIVEVCRELDIPPADFHVIKTAFRITHKSPPFLDEDFYEKPTEQLVDESLSLEQLQQNWYKLFEKEKPKFLEQQLKKYMRKDYFLLKAHELVKSEMPEFAKTYTGPNIQPKKVDNGFIIEPNIFDLHLGKLSWRPETGEDYDYKIARDRFMQVTSDIYHRAKELPVERFIYPFGSDFWHIDNKKGTTNAGTLMDYDSRLPKLFRVGRELLIESIDAYSEIAPVDVVLVAGNHDEEIAFFALEVLSAWYKDNDRVRVWDNIRQRKYVEFGINMIGFDHGAHGFKRLPAVMSVEASQAWARTKVREWHTGHLHSLYVKEEPGVTVRRLSSVTATDAWHDKEAFKGALCRSQTFQWCRSEGQVSVWNTHIWTDNNDEQSVLTL